MPEGLIIKSTGDRMTVLTEDGETCTCRARGRFRLDGTFPLAGDRVIFRISHGDEQLVERVLSRKNYLIRPPVANIKRLCIVASMAPPVTDRLSIDTLTAAAEYNGIQPVIIVNKYDLVPGDELAAVYRKAGYPVFLTSTFRGDGVDELRSFISDGLSVFAGSSGVGKSSLLNQLLPEAGVRTSYISQKIGRGRHTTRHVELFPNGRGGYIVDTPGFSSIDPVQMLLLDKKRLENCFPEFEPYIGKCRYDDCAHTHDDDCAIQKAVDRGEIDRLRHENFVTIYDQVSRLKDWQIREMLKKTE